MVETVESRRGQTGPGANSFKVYTAGSIFTQHDLLANVHIKKSVWRQSNGRFELVLPQSKELRDLDRADLAAHIRNLDLAQVLGSDAFLARFDGLEPDAGVVVEFMLAKFVAKPTVILRSDSRRSVDGLDEPYNLMLKNWPRSVEVRFDSIMKYAGWFAEERGNLTIEGTVQAGMEAEFRTVQRGVDEIARGIIQALHAVLELPSPYPPEYREIVYRAARHLPGAGFDQLVSEQELDRLLERLDKAGAL